VTFWEEGKKIGNIFRKDIDIPSSSISYPPYHIPLKISRYLPVRMDMSSVSIFHSSYFRTCNNTKAANIITVYDFIYELFGIGIPKRVHVWQCKCALQRADAIICISKSTQSDLLRLYPDISPEKTRVIHLAAGNNFYPLKNMAVSFAPYDYLLNKKYILFVGSRSTHKNFNIAVDVVKQLKEFTLVAVGGGKLTEFDKCSLTPIQDRFFHIESPSSKNLNVLYNHAFCLLYPSSYEGFGIPIAEAMKAGCPVIALSASSIPEVAGNAGLMVETIGCSEIAKKIETLNDEAYRNGIIAKGLIQGNSFSWDRCFRETMECYVSVYENRLAQAKA
jgi:mannosyltransferase